MKISANPIANHFSKKPRQTGGTHASSPKFEDIQEFRVFQPEPNLTAILPGICPAKCPFCVEPQHKIQTQPEAWIATFDRLLEELPFLFKTITISGGEPSLSFAFSKALALLEPLRTSGRLKRIILTTNGCSRPLSSHMAQISRAVTHVNISRHAVDDGVNSRIFKTDSVPGSVGLRALITQFNQAGLPVNLNCVHSSQHVFGIQSQYLSPGELRAEALRFITFAKDMGATSVVFRADHRENRLDERIDLEDVFSDHAVVHEARCPSCRVVGKLILGLPVNFKRSIFEPTAGHPDNELYELILHSDGSLCRDWARQHPVRRPLPHAWPTDAVRNQQSEPWSSTPPECREPVPGCGLLSFTPPIEL